MWHLFGRLGATLCRSRLPTGRSGDYRMLPKVHPVDWKRLDWSSRRRARSGRGHCAWVGNQGFSVPIRGPVGQFALFTVSHDCSDEDWVRFTEENRRDLILFAHEFNVRALELEPGRSPEQSRALSPREIDAMTLVALAIAGAVAETLRYRTYATCYIESARSKLGALNTTHAVARALSRGLIVV